MRTRWAAHVAQGRGEGERPGTASGPASVGGSFSHRHSLPGIRLADRHWAGYITGCEPNNPVGTWPADLAQSLLFAETARTVKAKEKNRPTFSQFTAQCRESFAFLAKFGFTPAQLPKREFVNEFQARFSTGKLTVVIEGINWGYNTDVYLEGSEHTSVPLVLFIPREHRGALPERRAGEPDQCFQIRADAKQIAEHCVDLLLGDMTRFYDRNGEWRRMTGKDRSHQTRVLP